MLREAISNALRHEQLEAARTIRFIGSGGTILR